MKFHAGLGSSVVGLSLLFPVVRRHTYVVGGSSIWFGSSFLSGESWLSIGFVLVGLSITMLGLSITNIIDMIKKITTTILND